MNCWWLALKLIQTLWVFMTGFKNLTNSGLKTPRGGNSEEIFISDYVLEGREPLNFIDNKLIFNHNIWLINTRVSLITLSHLIFPFRVEFHWKSFKNSSVNWVNFNQMSSALVYHTFQLVNDFTTLVAVPTNLLIDITNSSLIDDPSARHVAN